MSKFNTYRPEFILKRDDILIRLIHKEEAFISKLLFYRKRQELIEGELHAINRRKYRLKSFNGLRYTKNFKRTGIKKDMLDWSFRRLPIT